MWSPVSAIVPLPIERPPSLKTTVPVGAVPELPLASLTVAVNVTDAPSVCDGADDITAIVLAPCVTICVTGEPLLSLGSKLASPLYVAVIMWLPRPSVLMARAAVGVFEEPSFGFRLIGPPI